MNLKEVLLSTNELVDLLIDETNYTHFLHQDWAMREVMQIQSDLLVANQNGYKNMTWYTDNTNEYMFVRFLAAYFTKQGITVSVKPIKAYATLSPYNLSFEFEFSWG